MQPMKVYLPWLNSYSCHTKLYARLWKYLSSYSKQVDFCVWILFMWYQKLKVSCMVVFRGEGAFEPTPEMLCMGSRTNPLTWEVMWVYPTRQCFLRLCHRTHLYSTIWHSPDGKAHWNWTCFEISSLSRDCTQHKVVIPFWQFGITNQSHLQGSRCPRRICLDSRQPTHTWCLLGEWTFTELMWW
jgi:hypothetical protein